MGEEAIIFEKEVGPMKLSTARIARADAAPLSSNGLGREAIVCFLLR